METKFSLTFSFCGSRDVTALSVAKAIAYLVELTEAIAENEYPDVEFRMSVAAVTPGSLKFDFLAAASVAESLLQPDAVSYAANLISVASSAFSIKKFLRGKPPKKRETEEAGITITNTDGATVTFPAGAGVYFVDNRVDKSITNIINAAKVSDGVTGIAVEADGKRVHIGKADFEECGEEIDIERQDTETMEYIRRHEVLFVRQADFMGGLKWRFTGDQNISADVTGTDFLKKVHSGEVQISAKTYIVADVLVKITLNDDGSPNERVKPSHTVVKVQEIHSTDEGQLTILQTD